MNKKVFNTVLLFTGSVLLGIIVLQVLWLNNLSKIRRHELSSQTQQALLSTVGKLQKQENLLLIMENFHRFIPDSIDLQPLRQLENIRGPLEHNFKMMESLDSFRNLADLEHLKHIRKDSLSVNINIPLDSLHDMNHALHNHLNLERKIVINSKEINRLNDKVQNIDSLVHQMIFELDASPLYARVNPDTLKSILTTELKNRGVNVAFEYAIVRDDSIYAKSPGFIETSSLMRFEAKLFPDDIFDKDMKVIMYYPASSSAGYVFSKMQTFLLLTGIFTVGILVAFYLTIRTIKKQKKLDDMKNDFINNITHEFKTPIATSSIAIAALENQQVRTDNEKFDYFTHILKEENLKMNQHVEKVLQLAMMDKGKLEVVLQEMDGNKVLRDSLKGFDLLLKENKVQTSEELNASQSLIKADSFHLIHVFNNIIDNAIKYRSDEPKLTVTTENIEGKWVARFVDNGKGMSNEVLKNAFDAFYRGQKGDLHDVKGFGLGLSYAKNIIESCKGTIHINSTVNKGTEVIITLPLA